MVLLLTGAAGFCHALSALVGFVGRVEGTVGGSLGSSSFTACGLSSGGGVAGTVRSTTYLAFQRRNAIGKRINGFLRGATGEQKYCHEGEKNVFHLWVSLVSNGTREPYHRK